MSDELKRANGKSILECPKCSSNITYQLERRFGKTFYHAVCPKCDWNMMMDITPLMELKNIFEIEDGSNE